jgi:CHAD domain-containing protein
MSDEQRIVDVLSQIWQQQWSALEQHRAGAALGNNPEDLHRLRVALRRTRALLKAFKKDLPSAERRHFVLELKWLAASTGAARDLDVHLASLRDWSASQGAVTEAALAPVIAQLIDERAVAHQRVRKVLASQRYRRLALQWLSFLAALPQFANAAPARELALLKLAKQSLKLLRGGLAIKPATAPQDLHRLRIRGKRLRYLLESFESFFDHHKHYRRFLQTLKQLQQELGDYRDSDIAVARVEELIAGISWPAALPWLEAWRDELTLRKRRARAGLSTAVAAFNKACRHLPS